MEKKPTLRVLKEEEERSEESVDIATKDVDIKERIVLSESKKTEDPEVVVTTRHARTAIRKDTRNKIAGNYIQRRCHNGSKIRSTTNRLKLLEQEWR